VKVFCRYSPRAGKSVGAAGGAGLARAKHTINLLSRDWGNWPFLGAIFTTLDFTPDAPEVDSLRVVPGHPYACRPIAFPAPSTGCAALHFLSDDSNTTGGRSGICAARWATALRHVTRLPCRCRWNKFAVARAICAITALVSVPLIWQVATLDLMPRSGFAVQVGRRLSGFRAQTGSCARALRHWQTPGQARLRPCGTGSADDPTPTVVGLLHNGL